MVALEDVVVVDVEDVYAEDVDVVVVAVEVAEGVVDVEDDEEDEDGEDVEDVVDVKVAEDVVREILDGQSEDDEEIAEFKEMHQEYKHQHNRTVVRLALNTLCPEYCKIKIKSQKIFKK